MFLALLVGLGGGIAMSGDGGSAAQAILAVARPIGRLWLDALTMTIVPLVFGLIVNGISAAAQKASASRTALRSILWFAILLAAACTLSAIATTGLLHLWPASAQAEALRNAAGPPVAAADATGPWYDAIIPANPIKAAAETAMVPLVVFALLFGFALTRIAADLRSVIVMFIEAIVQTMLVLVNWVLWLAPLGIAALAFVAGISMGATAAGALGQYVVVASAACLLATLMAYVAATVAGRISPLRFARAAIPAQAIALGTQSSLATLPVMIEATPALGVEAKAAGVVLPLAVSLFRAASAAANIAVALYLADLNASPSACRCSFWGCWLPFRSAWPLSAWRRKYRSLPPSRRSASRWAYRSRHCHC
jgi:Na+/H+-dicarboxylate symporter